MTKRLFSIYSKLWRIHTKGMQVSELYGVELKKNQKKINSIY